MANIEINVLTETPPAHVEAAERHVASLQHYAGRRPLFVRLSLRRSSPHTSLPYLADASMLFDGRVLAAHALGHTPLEAAEAVTDLLRRRIRRIVGSYIARRNEFEAEQVNRGPVPTAADGEPRRMIVRRRPYVDSPLPTLDAISDLLDLDVTFYLFRHVRTGEDVVVDRLRDGRIEMIFPPGSVLADEGDIVVAHPSRYDDPLTLTAATEEMDMIRHRFMYFTDAADGRGKVLYPRIDGNYGLVAHP
jgi:hypothetical protein